MGANSSASQPAATIDTTKQVDQATAQAATHCANKQASEPGHFHGQAQRKQRKNPPVQPPARNTARQPNGVLRVSHRQVLIYWAADQS